MLSIDTVRQELQCEIEVFINDICDERQKEQMRFVFYGGDSKIPKWGSLARGSLLLLLSGGGSGRLLLAKSIELSHHASLIVDDQIDKAYTRRGKPVFWIKYGSEDCILFSHMMVAMAITGFALFDRNHDRGGHAQSYALKAMHHMADAELEARRTPIDSLEIYLSRAHRKTGSLYKLVGQLAGLISTTIILDRNSCVSALQMIGVARQMLDDFVDATPTSQQNSIFVSQRAEEENRNRSIYQLLEYGFTLNQLKKLHEQYSCEAIQSLKQCLCNGPEKQVIISLCEQVCLGSSSVAKARVSARSL
ncbi:polyprenyl synthetase family protein [candidate division WOR-3 bacterium]|nr:polyprenyl synthetase family protein [candidate division WOR-3 bacterium]